MKKITGLFALSFFLMVSCGDAANGGGNNTADSNSNAEISTSPEDRTTPPATPPQEYSAPPSKVDVDEVVKDTPRTSISVGREGASVKTKKGTGVSYDKEGVKINSKDVKVDIKRDTL
jgi:hypothetical protein